MTNYELSFLLKNDADVLIIGSGGGNEVFHAHQWGASRIVSVELHERILDVSTRRIRHVSGHRALTSSSPFQLERTSS